jgi:hypothetical protein
VIFARGALRVRQAPPLAARAPQGAMPVVGYLSPDSQDSDVLRLAHLRKGLSETGYIEGRDITLDQAFGLPEVLVAVSTSRLCSKRAGKTRTLMPGWDSSGESQLTALGQRAG